MGSPCCGVRTQPCISGRNGSCVRQICPKQPWAGWLWHQRQLVMAIVTRAGLAPKLRLEKQADLERWLSFSVQRESRKYQLSIYMLKGYSGERFTGKPRLAAGEIQPGAWKSRGALTSALPAIEEPNSCPAGAALSPDFGFPSPKLIFKVLCAVAHRKP